jgi:hypothetical protein
MVTGRLRPGSTVVLPGSGLRLPPKATGFFESAAHSGKVVIDMGA